MIFTTYWFLFFAAACVAIYWLLPGPSLRQGWLAAACVVFHFHFAGPAGVLPIVILMVITYLAGLSRNRLVCLVAMIVCGLALCFYKYAFFFIGAIARPLSDFLAESLAARAKAILPGAPPLAVSFFTFEFVHYLFEVRKGGEPIRSPLKFACFAIFFPSLVAGPIKRYTQFLPSLEESSRSRPSSDNLGRGLARIALGFAKKVLIADQLTAYVDQVQPHFELYGIFGRWVIVGAIAFRILLDFSGYSDIAIGCAQLLGITLPENFNWPYAARSIQDFWQRWHISLSSWIRDYVYIPMGGNRHGALRRVCNAAFAFAVCGLWHGPAWHFVIWGVYHGLGLVICSTYRQLPAVGVKLGRFFDISPNLCLVLTQGFVWIGWLLFFYPSAQAWHMTQLLFSL